MKKFLGAFFIAIPFGSVIALVILALPIEAILAILIVLGMAMLFAFLTVKGLYLLKS